MVKEILREISFPSISPPPSLLNDIAEGKLEKHKYHIAGK